MALAVVSEERSFVRTFSTHLTRICKFRVGEAKVIKAAELRLNKTLQSLCDSRLLAPQNRTRCLQLRGPLGESRSDDAVGRGAQLSGAELLAGDEAGNKVLIYHSSCQPPGVVGVAEVVKEAYPDPTQFDASSPYYDERSSEERPHWVVVDVRGLYRLERFVSCERSRRKAPFQR